MLNVPTLRPIRSLFQMVVLESFTWTMPPPVSSSHSMLGPWIVAGTSSPLAYFGVAVSEPLQPTGSWPAPLLGSAFPFLQMMPKKATRR
jgi:hypothetical protein